MRRFLPLLVILLIGCSGGPGSASTGSPTTASDSASASAGSAVSPTPAGPSAASSVEPAASSEASAGSNAGVLPAACAKGLADYLVAIEPLVSKFDPAKAKLGAFFTAKDAVQEKSVELLMANDATAPYSCSEVGLEWAYFDSRSPWDAVLVVAGDAAPGTVGYLTAQREISAIDVNPVTAYGVEGCDAAVASIKKGVKANSNKGKSEVVDMGFKDAVALLGLYRAYMNDVAHEVCPRDVLGNDEFDFFGAAG
jgi:hypothetical protein